MFQIFRYTLDLSLSIVSIQEIRYRSSILHVSLVRAVSFQSFFYKLIYIHKMCYWYTVNGHTYA